jgi:predicted nucleic acid-binding protein
MGLIIDTNVFINVENKRFDLSLINNFSHYGEAYIAAITVSELLAGVHLAKNPEQHIKRSAFVESIITRMPVLEFNEEAARVYAQLYAFFLKDHGRGGTKINVHDLLIASTAISNGFAVLTSNIDDFKNIPSLIVESPI